MSKFYALIVCMIFLCAISFGQNNYSLSGTVVDKNSEPLTGAAVTLLPIEKGAIVDARGKYTISGLTKGTYTVTVSFIGFKSVVDTILINGSKTYNARLVEASIILHEVVVAYDYAKTRKKEEALNVEIVNEKYLKQNMGGSLMKTLERLPGITTIDIGSGQSKPVIRGLGFNRVVVVENGVKHEGQEWGEDHGLEIDQYAVDNLEIIKGPASLMYGSDAIGGVIDLKNRNLPADNSIGGTVDLSGKTNNNLVGSSISMYGRKKWFFADLRATILDYGDYKVPTDSVDIYSYRAALYKNHLRNTAGKEQNLNLSFGIIQRKFLSRFFVSDVNTKSGFFANAHGLEPRNVDAGLHDKSSNDIHFPYQKVNHFKTINKSEYTWGNLKFESDLGFQRNFRQEWSQYVSHGYMPAVFPGSQGFDADLERQFEKYVYSSNLKFTYYKNDFFQLLVGLNSEYQDNRIDGRGFIIPAFKQLSVGGFLLAKYALSAKSSIQMGVRYDYTHIKTLRYNDWFSSPVISLDNDITLQYLTRADAISRHFSNTSWSVGYNYNLPTLSFKTNVGKSFRVPIAKELAANGVNYHHFSYEAGKPDLSPEVSYQLDAGVEYNSNAIAMGVTPFLNYFSNYIYLNPTSEHDRLYGNGNQIYNYTQSEVFRYGGEMHAHYQVIESLRVGVMGEFVYSKQLSGEKKGFTLPFSPPASMILNVKYDKRKIKSAENLYLSIDYRITAPQNNIVPPEESTDGYQIINISLGGDVKLLNQKISISMQVQNLLNTKYFNHTSYYRLINVPEPGRNLIMNISIPFSGKIK